MIVNAGLPKTGTTSISEALNILGFKCIHDHRGEIVDTGNYSGLIFHRLNHVMENFKEAIVFVSVRDFDSWIESCKSHFKKGKNVEFRTKVLGAASFNYEVFKELYDKQNENIKKYNLPIVDVKNEWQDLCELLKVNKPNRAFPHLNKR